jgi:hypothetical protein
VLAEDNKERGREEKAICTLHAFYMGAVNTNSEQSGERKKETVRLFLTSARITSSTRSKQEEETLGSI